MIEKVSRTGDVKEAVDGIIKDVYETFGTRRVLGDVELDIFSQNGREFRQQFSYTLVLTEGSVDETDSNDS